MMEEKLKLDTQQQQITSRTKRESNELDISIQVAQKRLADKLIKLKEVKANTLATLVRYIINNF